MEISDKIRVRIGPSPTGDPHVGTAYVALFNYAFAKKNNGKFIVRIEDTDKLRSKKSSELDIMKSLKWIGLNWDEGPDIGGEYGPYRQSDRLEIYQKHAQKLKKDGKAYVCVCSNERLDELRKRQQALKQPTGYDGKCRALSEDAINEAIKNGASHVLRLKTPDSGQIEMFDLLRGKIVISATEVDDQILVKSDGYPTYHLASVVDDHEMKITHVIRGEEWISSLPKHILLFDAFGFKKPHYCHLPLLRNADKSKVSKRKNPVSLNYFKQAGFLPEVMLNFLGLMAYSLPSGQEIFSLNEFIEQFDLNRISLGGPVFDLKKLTWLNGKYLRESLNNEDFVNYLTQQLFNHEYLAKIIPLIKERVEKSEDFIEHASFFFTGQVHPKKEDILIGAQDEASSINFLEEILDGFENLPEFSSEHLNLFLKSFCQKYAFKPKDVFMPIRMIMFGTSESPPLFDTMAVLGKERCRTRIGRAIQLLKQK